MSMKAIVRVFVAALMLSLSLGTSAFAGSKKGHSCATLKQDACSKKAGCSWVANKCTRSHSGKQAAKNHGDKKAKTTIAKKPAKPTEVAPAMPAPEPAAAEPTEGDIQEDVTTDEDL
jgi:hypothetical protein